MIPLGTVEKLARHAGRILYGTDFPNLPYERDRELRVLSSASLDEGARTDPRR